jgi:hypothetical protein
MYIKILNYNTNAPTCFGASAPSTGSFITLANAISKLPEDDVKASKQ